MIAGITSLSHISIVPIVVSIAGTITNGLRYYALYAKHDGCCYNGVYHLACMKCPIVMPIIAFAYFPQIQEAALSFYSYLILTRVLRQRDHHIFMSSF
jgi:hypothetical protein